MKTKLCILSLSLLLVGCDDMLTETPDAFLAPENFYRTATDAEAAIVSVYEPLVWNGGFRNHLLRPLMTAPDIGTTNIAPPETHDFTRLTVTADNRYLPEIWEAFYQLVYRANIVIERVPDVQMNQTRRAAIVGEAKFLRALAYFYLVRSWGDVPLITSPEEASADIARTPADQVYEQIIKDATDAAAALPAELGRGRATKGAAQSLLAEVYLTRQQWQNAADAAKQVIDSGVYRLFPNYLHAFVASHKNGMEHIFSAQHEREVGTTSILVRLFWPRELVRNQGGGNSAFVPTDWHYNSYLPGDYRHEVTYFTQGCNPAGRCRTFAPHIQKHRPTNVIPMNHGDANWPIYRYGDVLLMYAEALNELGRTAEAVQYTNMIRARARNGTGNENRAQPANYSGPMTQAAVRTAIRQERAWELAHEGKRWYDLKRWGVDVFMSQLALDPDVVDLEPTDMLWPIPLSEMDINPALTQNPGY